MFPRGGKGIRRGGLGLAVAAAGIGAAVALAGCASLKDTDTSDAKPAASATASPAPSAGSASQGADAGKDPGCTQALQAISQHGPSLVKLAAEGRGAIRKATVQVLVDGLDTAADAAGSPQTKQGIQRVANDYDDFFDLTDKATTIPLSTLLKDSTALEFMCR